MRTPRELVRLTGENTSDIVRVHMVLICIPLHGGMMWSAFLKLLLTLKSIKLVSYQEAWKLPRTISSPSAKRPTYRCMTCSRRRQEQVSKKS